MTELESESLPATEPLGGALANAWRWIVDLGPVKFWCGLAVLTVARTGFDVEIGRGNLQFVRDFPRPYPNYQSSAVLGPTLGWMLHATTTDRWFALHAVLTVLVVIYAGWLLCRRAASREHARIAAVWLAFSAAPAALMQWIGYYDVYSIFGGSLVALGTGWSSAVVGGAALGLTNSEQGVAALAGYLLVKLALAARTHEATSGILKRVGVSFVSLIAARVGVAAWLAAEHVTIPSRVSILKGLLIRSVKHTVEFGSVGLYSWLGVAWILVAAVAWTIRADKRSLLFLVLGAIAIPGLAAATTVDGTRVFATCAWPALCALVLWVTSDLDGFEATLPIRKWTAGLLVAGLLIPAVVTSPVPSLRLPFGYLVQHVVGGPA